MLTFKTYCTISMLVLVGFSPHLAAQDMPHSVIGSNGSYYQNLLFGSLHFTTGEVAVARYDTDIELTEGFHQAYYNLIVDTKDVFPVEWKINVYPNPTVGRIHVNLPDESFIHLQLFNSLGQLVFDKETQSSDLDVDMSQFPAGTFWLKLNDTSGRQASFQIQKISH